MKDIKYYRTTTDNTQVLRLINGVMQVFDIEKKWVDSMYWFNNIFFNDFTDFEEISENDAFTYIDMIEKYDYDWPEGEDDNIDFDAIHEQNKDKTIGK